MGYRDSLDPARARIAELRADVERQKGQVLPAFWRLPVAAELTPVIRTLDLVSDSVVAAASLDELVALEAHFERLLAMFGRAVEAAHSAETMGALLPPEPEGAPNGEDLDAVIHELSKPQSFLSRLAEGVVHEVRLDLLKGIRRAKPANARCLVRTRGQEMLVQVLHDDLVFRVCFARKSRSNDADPFDLMTTLAVPVGAPRLYAKPRGYFDDWLEAWGATLVHTGHDEFDQLFTLKGDSDYLHELFDVELRNALLMANRREEVRVEVNHGWATLHGPPTSQTFVVLALLRRKLHEERYLRPN